VRRYPCAVRVRVNGEDRDLGQGATLQTLVAELGLERRRIAVELNADVVSRERWHAVELRDADRVEIVQFVGGG
jgi:thiamine biosynthesis protein ThiS